MAVDRDTVKQHISTWTDKLKKGAYPFRQRWPAHLFRHEPVENAAAILRSGRLLSREASRGLAPKDIADKSTISHHGQAHSYARLYFRPRTPTQYRIEGIRKPSEYFHSDPETHAPVLVMMIFRSEEILTASGVCFSDGNMQSGWSSQFSTDADFRGLPFDKIYHFGPFDHGSDITRYRCAEVLVPHELVLDDRLVGVLCRSPAERATLLHMLGDDASRWSSRVRVYTEPGIFENRWSYVDSVSVSKDGVSFTTHPRSDAQPIKVSIAITSIDDSRKLVFSNESAPARHTILCKTNLTPGTYLVEISVDDCCAYRALSLIDDLPF